MLKHFHHAEKFPHAYRQSGLTLIPRSAQTPIQSVSIVLSFPKIPHRSNPVIRSLFCLASSAPQIAFEPPVPSHALAAHCHLLLGGCCALRMYDSHQLMDTWVVSRFLIFILFSGFESYISFLYNSFDYCSCFFHVGHSKRSEDTGTILAVKTIPSISFLICKASCGVLIVFLPLISQE